jgi:hypothetical protein
VHTDVPSLSHIRPFFEGIKALFSPLLPLSPFFPSSSLDFSQYMIDLSAAVFSALLRKVLSFE